MTIARTAKQVKDQILLDSLAAPKEGVSQSKIGAMIGKMNEVFGGDDARKLACAWLLDKLGKVSPSNPDVVIVGLSSKSIPMADWWGIWNWIGFFQEEGVWYTEQAFPLEAMLVLTEAMKAYGDLPPGKQEDRSFVDTIVMQAVSELKGVITNVKKPNGEWQDTRGLELPHDMVINTTPAIPPPAPKSPFKRPKYDVDF